MLQECALLLLCTAMLAAAQPALAQQPVITKRGTVECDLVEVTPLVFQGKLYRFEYVRDRYKANPAGQACFRFVDLKSGATTTPFALGYHLGSAFVDDGTVYVYGVKIWGTDSIEVFWSKDLESWQNKRALQIPNGEIFNTSVCKDPAGYTMAIELGAPAAWVGARFTNFFARSPDLLDWAMAPQECVYTKERYSACPSIRHLDGFYYMVYLERQAPAFRFVPHIVRSKDLIKWESSPLNPLMKPGPEDKQIANPRLTEEERKRIAEADNINNSDIDFCEFEGKTLLYYSWGNQRGIEFLAEAEFDGTESAFLQAFFPR